MEQQMSAYPASEVGGLDDYQIFQQFHRPLSTALPLSAHDVQYTSWTKENGAVLSEVVIWEIFQQLKEQFAFQSDSASNMYEYFMAQLNSRSSRMDCSEALRSLHLDYIGGENANYKKWCKAIDAISDSDTWEIEWVTRMAKLSENDYVRQVALYLLIWGEANNVRFIPECLCYIFRCALESEHSKGTGSFLDDIITPIYNFIRDQQYRCIDDKYVRRGKDHQNTVGYDDINSRFWTKRGLAGIKLNDGRKLETLPPGERFTNLRNVNWKFHKSFYEVRTWAHTFANFSRVWIIHITMFWYYTSFNSPTFYTPQSPEEKDQKPQVHVQLAVLSMGGTISCFISLCCLICESRFVRRNWQMAKRAVFLVILCGINTAPWIYVLWFLPMDEKSKVGTIISANSFVFSVLTFLYLAMVPPARYFWCKNIEPTEFTADFAALPLEDQLLSYLLWVCVFLFKFIESYFFLTLSMRDPTRVLSTMKLQCNGDLYIGSILCEQQARITAFLLITTNLILFFLDTYLWYVVCNCVFSVALTISKGNTIFTPWRNVFVRLPDRIGIKIVFSRDEEDIIRQVAKIWNGVVMSMYFEHLISVDEVGMLVYRGEKDKFAAPTFFLSQDDMSFSTSNLSREPLRRISFFAQSLIAPLKPPSPIQELPKFTVLIPHYAEKILYGLRETIRIDEGHSKISLLEYLKSLYPKDWELFVRDSKKWSQNLDEKDFFQSQFDDIPFSYLGFKESEPESTLRTRLWVSLRSQTLYRTVSGFSNYETALQILADDEYIDKFTMLISMQRYQQFTSEEKEDASWLFRKFPKMLVCYLEEKVEENGNKTFYSTLLDCSTMTEKYRIRLSGNPILGDGKSDNQNHAIIFTRGEYIQVIDANQDNYIEECLKIKAVLGEFEDGKKTGEYTLDKGKGKGCSPVVILGTREHIFSQNTGILGDLAAGKEQTFGTLFARTLSKIGGKLHYGHPDFISSIWMNTRGGISKAQRSLHLNEDIYAGMNVLIRGGRIKHCDYYQCGKGRDLGFGSIINFTKKIGAGMGEQMLSREYWWLGTNLPIDRFLSFYYAHAGFHINNVFIILSIELFMLVLLSVGSLVSENVVCEYDPHKPIGDLEQPLGCLNLQPVLKWIPRFVLSVFICFFISFVPLIIQELVEWGFKEVIWRLTRHLLSLAPLFEVFLCRIYAGAVRDNLVYGGAQYIATGRGFATSRESFASLYTKYAEGSMYSGIEILLVVVFSTITIWQPALLWFWITIVSMCLAPFIFNPHQFELGEFFLDYSSWWKWLWRQTTTNSTSWEMYSKDRRKMVAGVKRGNQKGVSSFKPKKAFTLLSELFRFVCTLVPYLFINAQSRETSPQRVNSLLRILIVGICPYLVNVAVLIFVGLFTVVTFGSMPRFAAIVGYSVSLVFNFVAMEMLVVLEGWNYRRSIMAIICLSHMHSLIRKVIYIVVSRELAVDSPQKSWWNGRWWKTELGWQVITQIFREFVVKVVELNHFSQDVLVGHLLQFMLVPAVFIPFVDKWHSRILFWRAGTGLRGKILSKRQKNRRKWGIFGSFLMFFGAMVLFTAAVMIPWLGGEMVGDLRNLGIMEELFQPQEKWVKESIE